MLLSEFHIAYITQKAIKGRALADHLAENLVDGDYEPLTTYYPDEEVLFAGEDIAKSYLGWRMFFDGATNFKGVEIRAVLISESGQHYPASAKIRFPYTSNMAEYEACILGIIMHPEKKYIDPIELEIMDEHAYRFHVNEELDGKPWYHDIRRFLATREYTENSTNIQKRALKRLGNHFFLNGEFLNMKSPYLASIYKAVTKKVVADFVRKNIVCRFEIPESIIIDNAANLNSELMREICEKFKIVHRSSTANRPQMNGAVEAANKNIKRILRKIVDNHRQWHMTLSFALLFYRTTMTTSTRATPHMLVYGIEAVISAEVEIPSLRVIQQAKLDDAEWIQVRQEQLMLIDEKRMKAVSHGQLYYNRMASAFNKTVKPRQFTPGINRKQGSVETTLGKMTNPPPSQDYLPLLHYLNFSGTAKANL
ncbi:uncharacterized protein [Nicotiana tomentosiformis]|uniref:uncharacterized protein n=1 Tax=Nicotiana tomentosiformis TaxID=4098 RepID=UPI00388C8D29